MTRSYLGDIPGKTRPVRIHLKTAQWGDRVQSLLD